MEIYNLKTLSWLTNKIFLPLIPALAGSLIRYLHSGQFSLEIIDGSELAFSMALASILIMSSASRLNDEDLRNNLTYLCILGIVAFSVMFAISSSEKLKMESAMSKDVDQLKNVLQSGSNVNSSMLQILSDPSIQLPPIISTIRSSAIILTFIVIIVAFILKTRYHLED